MPNWFQKLTKRGEAPASAIATVEAPDWAAKAAFEPVPEFTTRLAVESPGAPGMAGAEALYRKWADKWQEF
jgi:hypothetical protein